MRWVWVSNFSIWISRGCFDLFELIFGPRIAGKVMMVGTVAVTIPLIVLEEATLQKKIKIMRQPRMNSTECYSYPIF